MEPVPNPPIPAPELPPIKVYKHPFLMRTLFALGLGLIGAAITFAFGYCLVLNAAPLMANFVIVMSCFAFVLMGVVYFWTDLTKPTITLEEIWFRKRLDQARHCDTRVAQLKADYALLEAAAESLYKTLGKEGFAKLKDADIIDHAVELARKKKTVD